MFSELGYDAATFQEIAVRADLTRPAINHYFKSKRALYQEVIETTNAMVVSVGVQNSIRIDHPDRPIAGLHLRGNPSRRP